ncbi:MAG: carboxypeptidase-like regulatory domain-containing protein, partial [Pyrinomonadaceae bacterium]
ITLAYSTDNGATFTNFSTTQTVSTSFSTTTPEVFDLSGITTLNNQSNIIFRLFVSNSQPTGGGTPGTGAGTVRIDNFQVQAIGPTAAGATIGGRITSTNGRGIRNVRVMLAGGSLTEPIYATSTSFGYYQFPQVPSGETYVLQVFSKNYIFDSSSMVINLIEDLTETNFTGQLRGNALTGR